MRPFLVVQLIAALLIAACDRPVVVNVSPEGTQSLALAGDSNRQGVLTRAVKFRDREFASGTSVVVEETWLFRKDDKGGSAGWRVHGLYDPAVRHDGLMLPKGAVDVYFLVAVLPDRAVRVPVPAEALRLQEAAAKMAM